MKTKRPVTAAVTPEYVEYCKAHGKSVTAMKEYDRNRFPGGHMAGFIIWRIHGTKVSK
jgi:hypothetical protein